MNVEIAILSNDNVHYRLAEMSIHYRLDYQHSVRWIFTLYTFPSQRYVCCYSKTILFFSSISIRTTFLCYTVTQHSMCAVYVSIVRQTVGASSFCVLLFLSSIVTTCVSSEIFPITSIEPTVAHSLCAASGIFSCILIFEFPWTRWLSHSFQTQSKF